MKSSQKTEIRRINGYLREFITFFDSSGNPISQVMNPLMVELKPRDILQLFAGAFLISSPLCFTEVSLELECCSTTKKCLRAWRSFVVIRYYVYLF